MKHYNDGTMSFSFDDELMTQPITPESESHQYMIGNRKHVCYVNSDLVYMMITDMVTGDENERFFANPKDIEVIHPYAESYWGDGILSFGYTTKENVEELHEYIEATPIYTSGNIMYSYDKEHSKVVMSDHQTITIFHEASGVNKQAHGKIEWL